MPRDGSNIYHRPAGTDGVPNFPIESSKYNAYVADVEQDLNLPRPIVAGGTGANNATDALFNVKGELATQIVTNWDSQVWVPGSFYAASTATGTAPVAGHNFAGQVYIGEALANPPTNLNVILEARDLDNATPPGALYVRQKKAGVWSAWTVGTVGTLTDAEKAAARQLIYAAPFDALAYNGMQINGSMEVSQENGSTQIAVGSGKFVVDGWSVQSLGSQVTLSSQIGTTVSGLNNGLQLVVSTGNASPAGANFCMFQQNVEGYRIARLGWGSANAQAVTLAFWVSASRTGNFSGAIANSASNRSYAFSFTINAAATWEYKTVTIPGDTSGTWATNNTVGMRITFAAMSGSTYTTAAGVWTNGNFVAATGTVNGIVGAADYFQITGVVVLPGIEAPSAARSPLIMRPYDQELLTCKRYWFLNPETVGHWFETSATTAIFSFPFSPEMRIVPVATPLIGQVVRPGIGNIAIGGVAATVGTTRGVYVSLTTASAVINIPALLPSGTLSFDARL